jgi:hypothetical protein
MPKLKKVKEDLKFVPYASGFKPPNKHRQLKAVGFDGVVPLEYNTGTSPDDKSFQFFKPIPQPTSIDDWLAQYDEEGQTYKQFLLECPWLSTRKRKSVKQNSICQNKRNDDHRILQQVQDIFYHRGIFDEYCFLSV